MTTHRKLGAAIALVTDRSSDRRSRGLSRHHPGRRSRSDRNRDRHGSGDRKSTRLNSSHLGISYAVFCLKKIFVSSVAKLPSHAGSNEILISGAGNGSSWTIIVLLTFLTLIPSLLLCMTPFVFFLIVGHPLSQPLFPQTPPSN